MHGCRPSCLPRRGHSGRLSHSGEAPHNRVRYMLNLMAQYRAVINSLRPSRLNRRIFASHMDIYMVCLKHPLLGSSRACLIDLDRPRCSLRTSCKQARGPTVLNGFAVALRHAAIAAMPKVCICTGTRNTAVDPYSGLIETIGDPAAALTTLVRSRPISSVIHTNLMDSRPLLFTYLSASYLAAG